jgi:hypothetical protein
MGGWQHLNRGWLTDLTDLTDLKDIKGGVPGRRGFCWVGENWIPCFQAEFDVFDDR